jgi:hypothetical protein
MAEVRKNPLLEGLSGRVGDVVFRIRDGRTFVARRPVRGPAKAATGARGETISRFKQAVAFAREARHKPAFRSLSRMLRGYSPYHLAIQDFLSMPVIERVDAAGVGPTGGSLVIEVSEKIEVRSVEVRLLEGRGEAPAGGDATGDAAGDATGNATAQKSLPLGGAKPGATVLRAERVSGARRVSPGSEGEDVGRRGGPLEQPRPQATHPARGSDSGGPARSVSSSAAPPSTPAEFFFRRPSATPTPAGRAGAHASASASEPAPTARPEETDSGGVGSADGSGEGASLVTWTIWRLTLPRPGEIEVRALDYAGNAATRRMWAGPENGFGGPVSVERD